MGAPFESNDGRLVPAPRAPSERAFGCVLALAALVVSRVVPLEWSWPVALLGVGFAILAWLRPGVFALPHRGFRALGKLIGRVLQPVVLGLVFFAVVTPLGLFARLLGKDFIGRRFDPRRESYLEERPLPLLAEHLDPPY